MTRTLSEIYGRPADPLIHTLSITDYIQSLERGPDGGVRVVDPSPADIHVIEGTEKVLRWTHQQFLRGHMSLAEISSPREGLRFLHDRMRGYTLMASDDLQTLLGGAKFAHLVFPEHRGQKLGAWMHLALDGHYNWLMGGPCPKYYTVDGFKCRQAAHRLAVERAVTNGLDDIHPANLDLYPDLAPSAAGLAR